MRFTRTTNAKLDFTGLNKLADSVKAATGQDRLPRGFRDSEVAPALARHNARQANKKPASFRTLEDRKAHLVAVVAEAVTSLVLRNYKTAGGRWAGGDTTVEVKISESPMASGESVRVWSRNGKWSGANAKLSVTVMPAWRTEVQSRGLEVVGGILTTHFASLEIDGEIEVGKASWVEQGRGFELRSQSGWIAHQVDGARVFHSKASASAAVAGLKKQIRLQGKPAAEIEADRQRRAEARAARRQSQIADLLARISRHDLGDLASIRLRREDSIRAGNCGPGTDSFISRFAPDREEISLAELAAAIGGQIGSIRDWVNVDLDLARQVVAAILVAIRRAKRERRAGVA